MGFRFTDTFCTITGTSQAPYETIVGSPAYSSAYARFTPPSGCQGGGVKLDNARMIKNLGSNTATYIAFLSYGSASLPASLNTGVIGFYDSSTLQCFLAVNTNGTMQFYRGGSGGSNTAIYNPSSYLMTTGASAPVHGIEVSVTFSTTVGQVTAWVDGVQILNSPANLNTSNSGNAYASQVGIGPTIGNQNGPMFCDYLRVWDTSGSTQNAIVGLDRQPITKLPSGAGTATNWTANGLGSNYLCVQQVPPNTSDYVSSTAASTIDDYGMPHAGIASAPSQVVAQAYFEKDDGATRTYTTGVRSNGVAGVGSTFTAGSSYAWVQNCIANDPNTSAPWTASAADAANFLHEELS